MQRRQTPVISVEYAVGGFQCKQIQALRVIHVARCPLAGGCVDQRAQPCLAAFEVHPPGEHECPLNDRGVVVMPAL